MAKRRVAADAPKTEKKPKAAKPAAGAETPPAAAVEAGNGTKLPRPRLLEPSSGPGPELGDEDLKKAVGKAKAKHPCKCPHCSYRFVYRQDGAMPERLPCPGCFREFDIERFVSEQQKFDPTFGPEITCANIVNGKPCGHVYKRKMQGAGGADLERGTGGIDRQCQKCGALPPSLPKRGSGRKAEPLSEDFDASELPKR